MKEERMPAWSFREMVVKEQLENNSHRKIESGLWNDLGRGFLTATTTTIHKGWSQPRPTGSNHIWKIFCRSHSWGSNTQCFTIVNKTDLVLIQRFVALLATLEWNQITILGTQAARVKTSFQKLSKVTVIFTIKIISFNLGWRALDQTSEWRILANRYINEYTHK